MSMINSFLYSMARTWGNQAARSITKAATTTSTVSSEHIPETVYVHKATTFQKLMWFFVGFAIATGLWLSLFTS